MKPRVFSVPRGSKLLRRSLICLLLLKITLCSKDGVLHRKAGKPPITEQCQKNNEYENEMNLKEPSPANCISHCSTFKFAMLDGDACKGTNEHPAGDINRDRCEETTCFRPNSERNGGNCWNGNAEHRQWNIFSIKGKNWNLKVWIYLMPNPQIYQARA